MNPSEPSAPTFSWTAFGFAAFMITAIIAWVAWREYSSSGVVDPIFPAIALWAIAFIGWRWRSLRKELALGTFSLERYRANPVRYFQGSFLSAVVWVGSLVVVVIALAIVTVADKGH